MSEFDWSGLGVELKTISCLCLDVLIDAKSVDFQGQLGEVASRTSVKAGALKGLTRELITVFQEAMKDGWGIKQLETHFLESLEIPNAAVEQIVSAWQRNRERISASLLAKTLKANRLIDLDWNFGVTASSNDVDQVGKTFLQLKLTIEDANTGGGRDVFLELSTEQFFSLLSSMEQCKQFLDFTMNTAEE